MEFPALSCQSLSCQREPWHTSGSSRFQDITVDFAPGEICGVAGPEGCGKGLLLNVLGLLEPPDTGKILVGGQDVSALEEGRLRRLRNETFGFLFTHPYLLPSFSVAENVATPLFRICGGEAADALNRTWAALDFCGIAHQESVLTAHLSAAERQIVALARALVHHPKILIAVSPQESPRLLPLARRAAEEFGLCILWAGAESDLLPAAHRLLQIRDGEIVEDRRR